MTSPYPLFAFHVLESRLLKQTTKYSLDHFKSLTGATLQKEPDSPLFITWNISNRYQDELRGCIGTFTAQPVEEGIADYSLIAAFEDHRFNQITIKEFPKLSVQVTLLTNFEKIDDPLDWELGKHGIKIKFKYRGHNLSGTFLPSVATEQGWDKEHTLKRLIQKAGGDYRAVGFEELDVTRYQGDKDGVGYKEYKSFMEQNELETEL